MRKIPVLTAAILASVTATVAVAQSAAPPAAAPTQQAKPPRPDLTRAQAEERSKAAFARMDANRDGVLNAADREARRQAQFDRLDADRNGAISREEFAAAQGKTPNGGARRPGTAASASAGRSLTADQFTAAALARFDATDANKDGTVSAQERQARPRPMRAMARPPREG